MIKKTAVILALLASLAGAKKVTAEKPELDTSSNNETIDFILEEPYQMLTEEENELSPSPIETAPAYQTISDVSVTQPSPTTLESTIETNENRTIPFPRLIAASPSYSQQQSRLILSPDMLTTNFASLSEAVNQGTRYLLFPEVENPAGILLRTAGLAVDLYANRILIFTPNHEANHLSSHQSAGTRGLYIDFGNPLWDQAAVNPSEDSLNESVTEQLHSSGAGVNGSMNLASELLLRTRLRNSSPDILTQLTYLQEHSDSFFYTLAATLNGEVNNLSYDRPSDFINYNFFLTTRSYLTDPDQSLESVGSDLNNEREGNMARLSSVLREKYASSTHQVGTSVFSGLFNPYSLAAFYDLGDYLLTGDVRTTALPSWVPEAVGYWGIPGPYYGLRWLPRLATSGALVIDARGCVFPELGFGISFRAIEIPISNSGLDLTVGGELIYQEDGAIPVDESIIGGTLEGSVGFPLGEHFILRPNFSWQSPGVYSPRRSGINQDFLFGLAAEVNLGE